VVHIIEGVKYYVPLSSPKEKHLKMSNAKDFHKIGGGLLGVINFNYMLPVRDCDLILKDIDKEPDAKYKNLLNDQYAEILKLKNIICAKANDLYVLVQVNDEDLSPNDRKVKTRCCDFKMLESKMKEYDK